MTSIGVDVNSEHVIQRFDFFVNQFYKILPIKESNEDTLSSYITSLQREMLGFGSFICELNNDTQYISLVSILQHMIDADYNIEDIRSDVFKSISIIKKMKNRYSSIHCNDVVNKGQVREVEA